MATPTDTKPAPVGNELALPDELTPVEVEERVALIRADDEWADVDDGDLSRDVGLQLIPMLALDRKKGGGFTLEDGEITTELDVVLLARQLTRAWFKVPFGHKDSTQQPNCWSGDGVAPDERSEDKQADRCKDCPLSVWGSSDTGKTAACRESWSVWVFMPDPQGFGRFARIRFGGLAFAPFRDYWRSFGLRLPKRPPIAYITHISLVEESTPNGVFLAPRFTRTVSLERSAVQPLLEERDSRLAQFQALAAEDAVAVHDEERGAGPFDDAPATTVPADPDDPDSEPF